MDLLEAWDNPGEDMEEVWDNPGGCFSVPDSPMSTSSMSTTAQAPSQTAETGLNDGVLDQEQEKPEEPQVEAKTPQVSKFIQRKLKSAVPANVHHMKLRDHKPKSSPQKIQVAIPKPTSRKRQRKKSTSEVAHMKVKIKQQSPSPSRRPTIPDPRIKREDAPSPESARLRAIPSKLNPITVQAKAEPKTKTVKRKAKSPVTMKPPPRKYIRILPKPPPATTVIPPPPPPAQVTIVPRPPQVLTRPPQAVDEDSISPANKTSCPVTLTKRPPPIKPPPEIQKQRLVTITNPDGTITNTIVPPPWRGQTINWNMPPPTWAYVSSLLPGAQHGAANFVQQHNLWNLGDEFRLRALWTREEELNLVMKPTATSKEEVAVAAAISRIYSCRLEDLFRYGLRRPSPNNKAGDAKFWELLVQLLPHPYFGGDIARLRYALQQAVIRRVGTKNHTRPLFPPWSGQEPGFVSWLKECRERYPEGSSGWRKKNDEIIEAAEFRCKMEVLGHFMAGWYDGAGQARHDLNVIMNTKAERWYKTPEPVKGEWEKWLFVLDEEDVELLDCCLDELGKRNALVQNGTPGNWGRKVEEVTVTREYEEYCARYTLEERGLTTAARLEYMREKREGIISSRRECIIRLRMHNHSKRDQLTNPEDKGKVMMELLDIPPFDPNPSFARFPKGSFVDDFDLAVVGGFSLAPDLMNWLNLNGSHFPSHPVVAGRRSLDPADYDHEKVAIIYGRKAQIQQARCEPPRPPPQGVTEVEITKMIMDEVGKIAVAQMEEKLAARVRAEFEQADGGRFTEKVLELPEKGYAIPRPHILVAGVPAEKRQKTI